MARIFTAVIYVYFTVRSFPSFATNALVGVHAINAGSTVFTRVAFTVIDIFMTISASEALVAFAGEFTTRLALAFAVWSAHIRGNVPHSFGGTVGSHCNCAAVNHFAGSSATVIF